MTLLMQVQTLAYTVLYGFLTLPSGWLQSKWPIQQWTNNFPSLSGGTEWNIWVHPCSDHYTSWAAPSHRQEKWDRSVFSVTWNGVDACCHTNAPLQMNSGGMVTHRHVTHLLRHHRAIGSSLGGAVAIGISMQTMESSFGVKKLLL